jgi:hypothetical protein
MKYHRSQTPESVAQHGPSKIARMVASEFWRASSEPEYVQDVIACYDRARELMGILETIPFEPAIAESLVPVYKSCVRSELLQENRLTPPAIREFGERIAQKFDQVAERLQQAEHA